MGQCVYLASDIMMLWCKNSIFAKPDLWNVAFWGLKFGHVRKNAYLCSG